MKTSSFALSAARGLTLATALFVTPSAFANLVVNGVSDAPWSNGSDVVMTYTSDAPDPTTRTGALSLGSGSSYIQSSGSMTLTSAQFGIFFGQNGTTGAGTTTNVSGGNFTINANATDARFAFGNNRAGNADISGGLVTINTSAVSSTDAQKGFFIGRSGGGASTITLTNNGKITSSASRFGMGGNFTSLAGNFAPVGGLTNIVNFGLGSGAFEFTGLSALDSTGFSLNNVSYFNWTLGSTGTLTVNATDSAAGSLFFTNLANTGGIRINGTQTGFGSFFYSYANGLATITVVPEPGTTALIIVSGLVLALTLRRRRIA